ncbi:MAG: hypothetical protein L3K08_04240 [Thermoplasmata archaeon]|nr:hypothetical protein [Thermoplasmata archaeon]
MTDGDGAVNKLKGLGHGGKEAIEELAETFLKWVVPLVALVVGVFLYESLGGSVLFYALISETTNQTTSQIGAIAKWLTVFLWGGIGMAIWACGTGLGEWAGYIVRAIGAFFIGAGLGWVGAAIRNVSNASGLLDDLLTTVEDNVANATGA